MLLAAVADEQIVAATAATISWQPTDQHGEPADPGTVTVTVVRSDGTAVVTDSSTDGTGDAARTLDLTASQVSSVDRLTVTWAVSGTTVATTIVDVVGAVLITSAEYRDREPKAVAQFDQAKFRQARTEVDHLFRRVCGRSFVPRFDVERFNLGRMSDTLGLRCPQLERIAWATDEDDVAIDGATGVPADEAGIARLTDDYWPCHEIITIGYEHGFRRPPADVVGAAARAIRDRLNTGNSPIPDRATQYADASGAVVNLATAGLGPFTTGIPEVDEVLVGYRWAGAAGIA